MGFISHAQAWEDVLLWRALAHRVHHDVGFYIDVGAYDPDRDSVTRAFYDQGWRGINVEPVESFYTRFVERRPRDINLQVAVSDTSGEATFHEIVGHQLGTMVDDYAAKHSDAGMEARSYKVPTMTLTEICERHVKDREVHFLKIDVEGYEGNAVRGMDFGRYRPWILVIEATEPNRLDIPTHEDWDRDVQSAGYTYVHTTLPNRYYVAEEHADLAVAFSVPPDDYERVGKVHEREELLRELKAFREEAMARSTPSPADPSSASPARRGSLALLSRLKRR